MHGRLISEECLRRLHVITAVYSGSVATCLSVDNLLFLDSTKRSMAYNPWMQVWSVNCEICKNGLVLCSWFFLIFILFVFSSY